MIESAKIPPQALDLEQAVLGAIMLERESLDEVIGSISLEDFYKDAHQIIYKMILQLDRDNEPIDILTVTEALNKAKNLEEVGGPLYITQLTSKVATAQHIQGHARIIKEKSVQRQLIKFGNDLIKSAYEEDVEDLITSTNHNLDEITKSLYGTTGGTLFQDFLNKSIQEAEHRKVLAKEGGVSGIKTPLTDLNKVTGGFQPGELIIFGGRPSMGKSSFALAAAKKAAQEGNHVLFFSLEARGARLADKFLLGESNLDPEDFKNGKLNQEDWVKLEKAFRCLQDFGIHIFDSSLINIEYIRARSRVMKKKGQCNLIIIDYLQLIDGKSKDGNREREIAEVSRRAKLLAMELDIPIILLSQLNRSCELRGDKRPHLSDLRESGAIEQDADLVAFLYRPEYYGLRDEQGNNLKGIGELIVAKNRNGRMGTIQFKYNESMTQIYDMPRPGEIEPVDNRDFKNRQFSDS